MTPFNPQVGDPLEDGDIVLRRVDKPQHLWTMTQVGPAWDGHGIFQTGDGNDLGPIWDGFWKQVKVLQDAAKLAKAKAAAKAAPPKPEDDPNNLAMTVAKANVKKWRESANLWRAMWLVTLGVFALYTVLHHH